ncbi:transglycosylase domain-containing protein [Krasilnikoviella flava]|uniref:Membrane carboxypeptidase (Penicillin-binding protein) n=1 Tax=Krasilnikoviella flava TaxID=526729 RepID=A0A1T5KCE3_9MICO|nr:transglycosylase domain-containing protein [Krasilnikoviella flava]SKC61135.1 Membrane carboxypeptidase (penicillin-binding protein) [Krasilnikoviella flava]
MARRRRFWNYPRPNKGAVQRWLPSWRIVVGTGLTGTALGAGLFVAAWSTTTIPDGLDEVNNQATTVYWSNGKEMGTFAEQKRELIKYEDLPPYVGNAVVASEDSTFWTNNGIDVKGIARAAYSNFQGGGRQGASTLTQQYVERYYLDTTTSYAGKAREAIIALKVAQTQPKEEVLENYLNTIYWGRGTYGIQAASQEYFNKDAKDLTPSEAAMLSGIIPSPVNWDPSINLDQAKIRWGRSIDRMYEQGYITKDEHSKAEFPKFQKKREATNTQGGQKGYLLAEVKKELVRSKNNPDGPLESEAELETRGLKITTTIDQKLQKTAVEVEKTLHDDGTYGKADKNVRMSLVSMDPQTGAVKALYGGPDYVKQSLNTATQDVVQAGSTFKPFTLMAALEDDHTLEEKVDGNSGKVFPAANNGEDWTVPNFGGANYGSSIDLTTATAHSVNTAFVQLNEEVGPEKTREVAERAGIRKDENYPLSAGLSNVLGVDSVRPVDLARAYSTIAAGGYRTTPHVVAKVETLDGTTLYEGPSEQEKEFDPDVTTAAAYAMTKVVEDPTGSGRVAQELDRPVAGKTGTSNDNKSAWFAGFVPQLTTVVGLRQYKTLDLEAGKISGQDEIDGFGEWDEITGGTWPVRAWTDFMQVATEGMDVEEFPEYVPTQPTYTPSPTPTETEEEAVTVPNLVGQDVASATQQLEGLQLKVRAQSQNSEERKGTVLQMSGANTEVPVGTTITLVVSTGQPEQPEQVVVPNVVGQPRTTAEQMIYGDALQPAVREEFSDQPVGVVIDTDPGQGNSVDQGSTVTLIVSKGPQGNGNGNGNQPTDEPSGEPTDPPTEDDLGILDGEN